MNAGENGGKNSTCSAEMETLADVSIGVQEAESTSFAELRANDDPYKAARGHAAETAN